MAHGGNRVGSGRPAGAKSGKATKKGAPGVGSVPTGYKSRVGAGMEPLEVLIALAASATIPVAIRLTAATNAMPYLKPRLSQKQVDVTDKTEYNGDPSAITKERLAGTIARAGGEAVHSAAECGGKPYRLRSVHKDTRGAG